MYRTDNGNTLGETYRNGGSPRPWNVAKFSEFYLIAAEAAVKLGKNADAKTLVNVLRARAGKQTYCVNKRAAQTADYSAEMVGLYPRRA